MLVLVIVIVKAAMLSRLTEYRQGQVREEESEYGSDYDDEHEHEHEHEHERAV